MSKLTMSKFTGWQLRNKNMHRQDVLPAGASKWEKLLDHHSLSESEVILLAQSKSDKGKQLRRWIAEHRNSSFIPEKVLKALSLETMWTRMERY